MLVSALPSSPQEALSLLQDALDATADHVALLAPDGEIVFVNRAWGEFARSNGYADGESGLGLNYCDLCDAASGPNSDQASEAGAGIRRVLSGEIEQFELDYDCHAPDEERWFRLTVRRTSRPGDVQAIATHRNRTREVVAEQHAVAQERERLLASLELERARLNAIFVHAPAFLAVLRGPDHVFERVNPAYLQLVGFRDCVGKAVLDALPEVRGQGFVELLDQVRETGHTWTGRQVPAQLARTPGAPLEKRYLDMVYQRVPDGDGEYRVVAHGVDVTDQVQAAERLGEIESQLRDQFHKLPVPTFLWELDGDDFVLRDWNEAALNASTRRPGQQLGITLSEMYPGMPDVTDEMRQVLRENVVVRRTIEANLSPTLGSRHYEVTMGPQQPNRVLLHAVDITDRVELEMQLRQAQKMEAIGRLAGGVAHDFNNLLTVIGAHCEFLLDSLDSFDARYADAEAIQKAALRAAGLTRQLLAFGRKQILQPTPLALNAIIDETRTLLERVLGADIQMEARLAPDLGLVIADASQVNQVLMNLALNARDAMPDGGRLTISTRTVRVSPAEGRDAGANALPPGDYALVEVSDTGSGMSDEVKLRLFEPFFTTKAVGKGTGLGLATVYGIIKQSSGFVFVQSASGVGSTFQVYLPLVSEVDQAGGAKIVETSAKRGLETVLIVEDEPAVRGIAKRVLTRAGYVVLEAASGADALALSASHASPIHLVVSDAVMPGMGGAEVIQSLQAQRPGLRALLMSGYTDDDKVRRGIVASEVSFVQKPFTPADFARAVRGALDSPSS